MTPIFNKPKIFKYRFITYCGRFSDINEPLTNNSAKVQKISELYEFSDNYFRRFSRRFAR